MCPLRACCGEGENNLFVVLGYGVGFRTVEELGKSWPWQAANIVCGFPSPFGRVRDVPPTVTVHLAGVTM